MGGTVKVISIGCTAGCITGGCQHILQEYSLPKAEYNNKPWTPGEFQFVQDTMAEPLYEVAECLGRTYYATAQARMRIKRGVLIS
jgi:hypothetical protein